MITSPSFSDHFAKLQLVSPLLARIAPSSVLCSPRTSPRLGRNPFGSPCLPLALLFSFLMLALLFCLLLALLFSVLFILSPLLDDERCSASASSFSTSLSQTLRVQLFDVLLALLVPVLLYFILLFTTCSLAVVPFLILSPLAVALSLILSRDTMW